MPEIDGRTILVGLIGWPVEHSLSPAMHNAAFVARGLNWCYVPLPVPAGLMREAVRGLAALGFRGANVTVPHKVAALECADERTPVAQALGAVNTLIVHRREGELPRVEGTNTDAEGFLLALQEEGVNPAGRRAVVVGAGGAARAVVYALMQAGATRIVILNRTRERARAVVGDLVPLAPAGCRLEASVLTPETLIEETRTADLLVNATVVGMHPRSDESIWPENARIPPSLTVFDLVYMPPQTRLLQQARAAGAHPVGGLGMLVYQGARAFELWTGQEAPVEVMRKTCKRMLSVGGPQCFAS